MGKGDKKTRRGKIFKGSYGKLRPKAKPKVGLRGDSVPVPGQKVKPKRVP